MHYYFEVLEKYTVFSGRASRREYWMFFLFNSIISIIFSIIDSYNHSMLLGLIYAVATLLPSLAVGVRRLHDTDRSGWLMFLGLIPFIGSVILLVFFALKSKPHDNQYGPYLADPVIISHD